MKRLKDWCAGARYFSSLTRRVQSAQRSEAMDDKFNRVVEQLLHLVPGASTVERLWNVLAIVSGKSDLGDAIKASDDEFDLDLVRSIGALGVRIDEKVDALEAFDLSIQAMSYARSTHDAEHRGLIKNAVLNALTLQAEPGVDGQLMLRAVTNILPVHARVLGAIAAAIQVIDLASGASWYLGPCPDDLDPESYAAALAGRHGRILPASMADIGGVGRCCLTLTEEEPIARAVGITPSTARKVLADLAGLGMTEIFTEDGRRPYWHTLTPFGVRFYTFIREPEIEAT